VDGETQGGGSLLGDSSVLRQQGKVLLFVMNSTKYFYLNRFRLAQEAISSGYKVFLAAPKDDLCTLEKLEAIGVTVIDFPLSRRSLNPFGTTTLHLMLCTA